MDTPAPDPIGQPGANPEVTGAVPVPSRATTVFDDHDVFGPRRLTIRDDDLRIQSFSSGGGRLDQSLRLTDYNSEPCTLRAIEWTTTAKIINIMVLLVGVEGVTTVIILVPSEPAVQLLTLLVGFLPAGLTFLLSRK